MIFTLCFSLMFEVPIFLSTVTPGKLPICWFKPVSTLNRDDFPLFGLPTNAIFKRSAKNFNLIYIKAAKILVVKARHLRNR